MKNRYDKKNGEKLDFRKSSYFEKIIQKEFLKIEKHFEIKSEFWK